MSRTVSATADGSQPEVHEARTGYLDAVDSGARQTQLVTKRGGDLGGLAAQRTREHHRDVARPISERRITRSLHHRIDVRRRTKGKRRALQLGANTVSEIHSLLFGGDAGSDLTGAGESAGLLAPDEPASELDDDEAGLVSFFPSLP